MGSNKLYFNRCFDKTRLKNFLSWIVQYSGENIGIEIAENLKQLGFEYATRAGVSLSIDDLQVPYEKRGLVSEAELAIKSTDIQYQAGNLTVLERFQQLIDTWHRSSEILKEKVVTHFRSTDILNPVYMMAFSGARGSLSQVRQLVGMRGLMADPEGKIIDYPIKSNFREGLTLTEYFISCYGARKGLVDTALRTADAGYLTRRLVDVSHNLIVSEFDCGTTAGIFIKNRVENNTIKIDLEEKLVGRVLAETVRDLATNKIVYRNQEISRSLANLLSKNRKKVLVRSPLTCLSKISLCQRCYGWSIISEGLVSLGEAVGVIAAQSIGEPGTQLTMRTFHTGGVFSGDVMNEVRSPYEGILNYSQQISGRIVRTSHGKIAFLTKSPGDLFIFSLSIRKKIKMKIPSFTLLFVRHGEKVFQGQILAEFTSFFAKAKTEMTESENIKADMEGEIKFADPSKASPELKEQFFEIDHPHSQLKIRTRNEFETLSRWKKKTSFNADEKSFWILSGKIFHSKKYNLFYKDFIFPKLGDLVNQNTPLNTTVLNLKSNHYIAWNSIDYSKNFALLELQSLASINFSEINYKKFGYFFSFLFPVRFDGFTKETRETRWNKSSNFIFSNKPLSQTSQLNKKNFSLTLFPSKSKLSTGKVNFFSPYWFDSNLTIGSFFLLSEQTYKIDVSNLLPLKKKENFGFPTGSSCKLVTGLASLEEGNAFLKKAKGLLSVGGTGSIFDREITDVSSHFLNLKRNSKFTSNFLNQYAQFGSIKKNFVYTKNFQNWTSINSSKKQKFFEKGWSNCFCFLQNRQGKALQFAVPSFQYITIKKEKKKIESMPTFDSPSQGRRKLTFRKKNFKLSDSTSFVRRPSQLLGVEGSSLFFKNKQKKEGGGKSELESLTSHETKVALPEFSKLFFTGFPYSTLNFLIQVFSSEANQKIEQKTATEKKESLLKKKSQNKTKKTNQPVVQLHKHLVIAFELKKNFFFMFLSSRRIRPATNFSLRGIENSNPIINEGPPLSDRRTSVRNKTNAMLFKKSKNSLSSEARPYYIPNNGLHLVDVTFDCRLPRDFYGLSDEQEKQVGSMFVSEVTERGGGKKKRGDSKRVLAFFKKHDVKSKESSSFARGRTKVEKKQTNLLKKPHLKTFSTYIYFLKPKFSFFSTTSNLKSSKWGLPAGVRLESTPMRSKTNVVLFEKSKNSFSSEVRTSFDANLFLNFLSHLYFNKKKVESYSPISFVLNSYKLVSHTKLSKILSKNYFNLLIFLKSKIIDFKDLIFYFPQNPNFLKKKIDWVKKVQEKPYKKQIGNIAVLVPHRKHRIEIDSKEEVKLAFKVKPGQFETFFSNKSPFLVKEGNSLYPWVEVDLSASCAEQGQQASCFFEKSTAGFPSAGLSKRRTATTLSPSKVSVSSFGTTDQLCQPKNYFLKIVQKVEQAEKEKNRINFFWSDDAWKLFFKNSFFLEKGRKSKQSLASIPKEQNHPPALFVRSKNLASLEKVVPFNENQMQKNINSYQKTYLIQNKGLLERKQNVEGKSQQSVELQIQTKPGWIYFPKNKIFNLPIENLIIPPGIEVVENLIFDQHFVSVEFILSTFAKSQLKEFTKVSQGSSYVQGESTFVSEASGHQKKKKEGLSCPQEARGGKLCVQRDIFSKKYSFVYFFETEKIEKLVNFFECKKYKTIVQFLKEDFSSNKLTYDKIRRFYNQKALVYTSIIQNLEEPIVKISRQQNGFSCWDGAKKQKLAQQNQRFDKIFHGKYCSSYKFLNLPIEKNRKPNFSSIKSQKNLHLFYFGLTTISRLRNNFANSALNTENKNYKQKILKKNFFLNSKKNSFFFLNVNLSTGKILLRKKVQNKFEFNNVELELFSFYYETPVRSKTNVLLALQARDKKSFSNEACPLLYDVNFSLTNLGNSSKKELYDVRSKCFFRIQQKEFYCPPTEVIDEVNFLKKRKVENFQKFLKFTKQEITLSFQKNIFLQDVRSHKKISYCKRRKWIGHSYSGLDDVIRPTTGVHTQKPTANLKNKNSKKFSKKIVTFFRFFNSNNIPILISTLFPKTSKIFPVRSKTSFTLSSEPKAFFRTGDLTHHVYDFTYHTLCSSIKKLFLIEEKFYLKNCDFVLKNKNFLKSFRDQVLLETQGFDSVSFGWTPLDPLRTFDWHRKEKCKTSVNPIKIRWESKIKKSLVFQNRKELENFFFQNKIEANFYLTKTRKESNFGSINFLIRKVTEFVYKNYEKNVYKQIQNKAYSYTCVNKQEITALDEILFSKESYTSYVQTLIKNRAPSLKISTFFTKLNNLQKPETLIYHNKIYLNCTSFSYFSVFKKNLQIEFENFDFNISKKKFNLSKNRLSKVLDYENLKKKNFSEKLNFFLGDQLPLDILYFEFVQKKNQLKALTKKSSLSQSYGCIGGVMRSKPRGWPLLSTSHSSTGSHQQNLEAKIQSKNSNLVLFEKSKTTIDNFSNQVLLEKPYKQNTAEANTFFLKTNQIVSTWIFPNIPKIWTQVCSPYTGELVSIKLDPAGKESALLLTDDDFRTFSMATKLVPRVCFTQDGFNNEMKLTSLVQSKATGDNLTNKIKLNFANPTVFLGQLIRYGQEIGKGIGATASGQIIKIEKTKLVVRKAQPVFYKTGECSIENGNLREKKEKTGERSIKNGDFIEKNQVMITLSARKLKTEDIVQGIPKIEQIFEARSSETDINSFPNKLAKYWSQETRKNLLPIAVRKSIRKIQAELITAIQAVYLSQGVTIADKHIEVIVRQMTTYVRITYPGMSPFWLNEIIPLRKVEEYNRKILKGFPCLPLTFFRSASVAKQKREKKQAVLLNRKRHRFFSKLPKQPLQNLQEERKNEKENFFFNNSHLVDYQPILRGITKASLQSESFLSAASFQRTTTVLTRASLEKRTDYLKGLKENVILGETIPAGTGYLKKFFLNRVNGIKPFPMKTLFEQNPQNLRQSLYSSKLNPIFWDRFFSSYNLITGKVLETKNTPKNRKFLMLSKVSFSIRAQRSTFPFSNDTNGNNGDRSFFKK